MKNLPEEEWLNTLGRRLRDYSESPDDSLWEKISVQSGDKKAPAWTVWVSRSAAVISAAMFLWLLKPSQTSQLSLSTRIPVESQSSTQGEHVSVMPESENEKTDSTVHKDLTINPATNDFTIEKNHHGIEVGDKNQKQASSSSLKKSTRSVQDVSNKITSLEVISHIKTDETVTLSETEQLPQVISTADENEVSENEHEDIKERPEKKTEKVLTESPEKEKKQSSRRKRPLIFYVTIAPALTYQKFAPVAGDGIIINSFNSKSVMSSERFGFSFDMGLQYPVADKLEIFGGVLLYHQSQKLGYRYLSGDEAQLVQRSDLEYELNPESAESTVYYDKLNFGGTVGLLYTLKEEKLRHKVGAGVSYEHGFLSSSARTYDNGKSQYLSYQLFYRSEFVVNSRFNIFVQPFYSHALLSKEHLDEPFTLKPYRAGIGFGIVHYLR